MKYGKNVHRALMTITQFGINMIVPIFLCSYLGMYLDRKLGTSFFMIVLFFLGALGGFRNCYILAKKIFSHSDKKSRNKEAENVKKNRKNK